MLQRSVVLSCMILALGASAHAAYIFDVPSPDPFRNDSWAFGEIFRVGPQSITVTALGAFDDFGDGFITPGGIPVGIFRESDGVLLTSVNVLSTDPLVSSYRYASITPLVLFSGQDYRVVAVNRDDNYNVSTTFSVHPAVTFLGYGYVDTTNLVALSDHTGTERVWMANLEFDAEGGVIPEPGTYALSGAGLLLMGFVAARRRRSRQNC
jgi:hypothetical protein